MQVCTRCFDDDDLKRLIRDAYIADHGGEERTDERQQSFGDIVPDFIAAENIAKISDVKLDSLPRVAMDVDDEDDDEKSCSFCGECDAPRTEVEIVLEYIVKRVEEFYGDADKWLPYESREGGYQGAHWASFELIDLLPLELPNDEDGVLSRAIVAAFGEKVWCEYDPWGIPFDEELVNDWERFANFVKHERRFFFQQLGGSQEERTQSFGEFLKSLARLVQRSKLITEEPAGSIYFRARRNHTAEDWKEPHELGPPPAERATMSNRMSPPGIPVFYLADQEDVTVAEVGSTEYGLTVASLQIERPIRILDLARLPPRLGFFSNAPRDEVLGLNFLHSFASMVAQPIDRSDEHHIDYVPTQVFTEYCRDFAFADGKIDGLRYRSSVRPDGTNLVLFVTQDDLVDGIRESETSKGREPWIRLLRAWHADRPHTQAQE